jgi:tartrate-resistant acid phosphatase type 5
VAAALERAVAVHDVWLILTTGDNIYLDKEGDDDTGDEDDDWFFSFYQPYRYILNRIPFYPTVGNHDSSDTEKSDDRAQLEDNYFLRSALWRGAKRAALRATLACSIPFAMAPTSNSSASTPPCPRTSGAASSIYRTICASSRGP